MMQWIATAIIPSNTWGNWSTERRWVTWSRSYNSWVAEPMCDNPDPISNFRWQQTSLHCPLEWFRFPGQIAWGEGEGEGLEEGEVGSRWGGGTSSLQFPTSHYFLLWSFMLCSTSKPGKHTRNVIRIKMYHNYTRGPMIGWSWGWLIPPSVISTRAFPSPYSAFSECQFEPHATYLLMTIWLLQVSCPVERRDSSCPLILLLWLLFVCLKREQPSETSE